MSKKNQYKQGVICRRLIDFRDWLHDNVNDRRDWDDYVPVMRSDNIRGRIFSKVHYYVESFELGDDSWEELAREIKPNMADSRVIKTIPVKKGWERGRQATTMYYKKVLWRFKLGKWGFDGYILHYPEPCELPAHKDPVDGKHYRANLTLKGKSKFYCEKELVNWKILHIFRPDLYTHSLKVLTETYKLSLGFAKFN